MFCADCTQQFSNTAHTYHQLHAFALCQSFIYQMLCLIFPKVKLFKNLLDRGNEYWGIFMYISIPQDICKRPIWVFCV